MQFKIINQPTITQVIEHLKTYPADTKILLATDEEQNSVSNEIAFVMEQDGIVLLPLSPQDTY
jgi:hypothetical protein